MQLFSLLLSALLLLTSCAGSGANPDGPQQIRDSVHRMRVRLEPIVEAFVTTRVMRDCDQGSHDYKEAKCEDAEKLALQFAEVKVFADRAAVAWDTWLAQPTSEGRDQLIAALEAGLDSANALVPYITDDSDKALVIQTTIALIQAMVLDVAEQLEAESTVERAVSLVVILRERCGSGGQVLAMRADGRTAMFGTGGAPSVKLHRSYF